MYTVHVYSVHVYSVNVYSVKSLCNLHPKTLYN